VKISEFIVEEVTRADLAEVERFADALWGKLGIDIKFTHHFMDRLNDTRNGRQISVAELIRLFKKEYEKYGKQISKIPGEGEAVLKDLLTSVNLPFIVRYGWKPGDDKILMAKTIMRKQNFHTPDPEYVIGDEPRRR
jgi:hypothetical protein